MWILVWLTVTNLHGLQYFQLGAYESKALCLQEQEKARVMITQINITVACVQTIVEVNEDE